MRLNQHFWWKAVGIVIGIYIGAIAVPAFTGNTELARADDNSVEFTFHYPDGKNEASFTNPLSTYKLPLTYGELFDQAADGHGGSGFLQAEFKAGSYSMMKIWNVSQAIDSLRPFVPGIVAPANPTGDELVISQFGGKVLDFSQFDSDMASTPSYDTTDKPIKISYDIPFKTADVPMTITYKFPSGTSVPQAVTDISDSTSGSTAVKTIQGYAGESYIDTPHYLIPKVSGYTADTDRVQFDKNAVAGTPQNVTITYTKNIIAKPSEPKPVKMLFKVYGKQGLYRYQHVDFKKAERVQKYVKKPRVYAPVFTVVGTATSKAGNPRYKLSDGTYITAKSTYVAKLYWQKMTTQTMYVTNPKGIKTHATTTFNDQISRLKQGTAVPVTKLVKVGNVTRYELPDGTYITGSKCYVTPNKPKTVIKVQGKDGRNRYSDVNLNERLQHYKKGHIFKVTGWDYSHGWNTAVHGTKRYKVAGGYITGNPKLVKIIK